MAELSVISIGVTGLTVSEGVGQFTIPITREGDVSGTSTVDFSLSDNSARAGQDFVAAAGTVTFEPGESEKFITVEVLDDDIFEIDEGFNLLVGAPTGAILGDIRTASITIEDNDELGENTVAFDQAEYTVDEDGGTATITVVRTGDTTETVSVDYTTSDDYAKAGLDFEAISGTLVFEPGETEKTFEVQLTDDALPELDESLNLILSNTVGIDLGLQNTAELTIEDDDEIPFEIEKEIIVDFEFDTTGLVGADGNFQPGPTAFDWSADGTMYIARLNGLVNVFDGEEILDEPFIDLSDQVNVGGQRGMLGFSLHPDFPENPYAYFAFSYDPPDVPPDEAGELRVTRLVRYEADPDTDYKTVLPDSEVVLLETPPVKNFHAAGSIEFGINGELFFSHGDAAGVSSLPREEQAEELLQLDNPFGKLFRIDPITGDGFEDNPFYNGDVTSVESKVYNLGLRNPWRFTIHPETGEPYIGDVGAANWEEINTGRGENFGWPLFEGGNGITERTIENANRDGFEELYEEYESQVTAPIFAGNHSDGFRAITVGDFYTGDAYSDLYKGALFFADFNGESRVDALLFDEDGNPTSVFNFFEEKNVTYIETGPDGYLYYANLVKGEIGRWVAPSLFEQFGTNKDDVLRGTGLNDTLVAGLGNDRVVGDSGDDSVRGDAGEDTLNGGAGKDSLLGNDGDDLILGEDGNDTMVGGNGSDTLIGGSGRDSLIGNADDDLLKGGDDEDNLVGGDGDDTLVGGNEDDRLVGGDGEDSLLGGNGEDTLNGGIGRDTLFGNGGDDLLMGLQNNDTLSGGAGDDTLVGGTGGDSLSGNSGEDQLNGSEGEDTLSGGKGDDTLIGGSEDDVLDGDEGDDNLRGDDGDDTLAGGDGEDVLSGNDGDDLLSGEDDDDNLRGGDANDTLSGGEGDDLLLGEDGNDSLSGDAGEDTLNGGEGTDTLAGGTGDDELTGGAATDVFLSGSGDGDDIVLDFVLGEDVIEFDNVEFGTSPGQVDPLEFLIDNASIDGPDLLIEFDDTHSVRLSGIVDETDPTVSVADFVSVFATSAGSMAAAQVDGLDLGDGLVIPFVELEPEPEEPVEEPSDLILIE